jgi:hypothetical protein
VCTVPAIGDVCPDGSVYAGLSPDGNVRMYTTPNDGPSLPWNNGNTSGTVTTGATNTVTGEANTMMIVAMDADTDTPGFQPHQALQYCADLVAHSHDDWYMPSEAEIGVLGDSQQEIGGFNSGTISSLYQGAWEGGDYWLSHMHFWGTSNGEYALTGGEAKAEAHQVRCVRKDP